MEKVYTNANSMFSMAQRFDHTSRSGPKVVWFGFSSLFDSSSAKDSYPCSILQAFVSEYDVTGNEAGRGNLLKALAEAGFLIGLEKNRYVFTQSTHSLRAPLPRLHWCRRAPVCFAAMLLKWRAMHLCSWMPMIRGNNGCLILSHPWRLTHLCINHFCCHRFNPDAIVFDSSKVYGTPSYWMQQLFKESNGATLLDSTLQSASTSLTASAISWTSPESYIRIKASPYCMIFYLVFHYSCSTCKWSSFRLWTSEATERIWSSLLRDWTRSL